MGTKASHLAKDTAEDDIAAVNSKNPKEEIIKKLLANEIYRAKLEKEKNLFDRFASVLCNPDELQKSYLTTDWMQTVDFYKQVKDVTRVSVAQQVQRNETTSGFASHSTETVDMIEEEVTDEDIQGAEQDPEISLSNVNTIKVKIIVAEVADSKVKKSVRKLVSPILSKFDLLPEFGMFHSALMIGPWLIEWNNSALCVPRKCVSKAALLSADVDAISATADINEVVKKLSEIIVDWNINMKYKENGGDKKTEGNCQDFVEDVLKRLGMRHDFSGPLGDFLRKLREKGTCDMEFNLNQDFREKFRITDKKVVFLTHTQLDQFVEGLLEKEPEFDTKYKQEWSMLKSFDRAFWLRHYKFQDDVRWKPHKTESQDEDNDIVLDLACPFDDPENTYSVRFVQN